MSGLVIFSAIGVMADVTLFDGKNSVSFSRPGWRGRPVTEIAAGMLADDVEDVTGQKPVICDSGRDASIRIYNLATVGTEEAAELKRAGVRTTRIEGKKDGFMLKTARGKLYVVGADDRGTAYAMLEVSRIMGVSPWVWWNDATPARKEKITLPDDFETIQTPSVEYRGIFLNDEDWTLQPWSWKTFEPGQKPGTIGARTYKEIFKLLLRLRGNAIWPGMHGMTTPFYYVDGAKEVADSCAIAIGTSHCEPLMRNNVGEWKEDERGPYNYITNSESVRKYWSERLKEAGGYENMYTIGMRGIHDGHMEGVGTMDEKVSALQRVLDDQRGLLAMYVDSAVTAIPQVFVPYKEVLEIMDHGLVVPDDVTLMWCDDNYGYMTRLSDAEQQRRKGGAGVYYHLSYWGRPHDYMWLGATQPGLVYSEMKEAFDHNARKVWIVNVHDMKTASYPLELFMDMAWDINSISPSGVEGHLERWLCREFGDSIGRELAPVMKEYYRLCAIRRPEFMGWTQVELADRKAYPRGRSHVIDTEFSFKEFGNEADRYLSAYRSIADKAEDIGRRVPAQLRDNYFAQIKYPVVCAANMAVKMLEAQRARSFASGQCDNTLWERDSLMLGACARSIDAYQKIRNLTSYYNDSLAGGKWRHSMCMNPRDLAVFNPPVLPIGLTTEEVAAYLVPAPDNDLQSAHDDYVAVNCCDYTSATFTPHPVSLLGHSQAAVPLPKGETLSFEMELEHDGIVSLTTAVIPTQPDDTGDIRIRVRIDDGEPQTVSFKESGRTDRWKENVMRNQARIMTSHPWTPGRHVVSVTALDSHVILDQLLLDTKAHRGFYVIPASGTPLRR